MVRFYPPNTHIKCQYVTMCLHMSSVYWSTVYPVVSHSSCKITNVYSFTICLLSSMHHYTKDPKDIQKYFYFILFELNLKLWINKCRTMTNFRFLGFGFSQHFISFGFLYKILLMSRIRDIKFTNNYRIKQ